MDKNKKISFGFNKLSRKPLVVRTEPVAEKKVELVECLEGQSIKVKDAPVVRIKEPLVIPIKGTKNSLVDRIKDARTKREPVSEIKQEDVKPDSELTLDELAARALIQDAKNRLENNPVAENKITVLPVKEETVTIDGEKEPTLEDYENVPISDYGLAMLRGMGWKEGMGIGKNNSNVAAVTAPELRPKGLGLGATKMIKKEETARDKDGKELILKRGAYAKIIAGSHKGNYCEVQGLDDEAGTVIVRTSLKGEILTLNEFLLVPITQSEFTQGSKVLNNAKYEEYKEIADRKLEKQREENNPDLEHNSETDTKNSKKREDRKSKRYSSDDKNVSSDNESERKSRSEKRESKHENKRENHKSKNRDSSTSDGKSGKKYRDSSESDSRSSRKKKRKDKKKDKHRDRSSRSRKSDKKSESRHRDRSASYESKKKDSSSSKKNKSKSKYKSRSVSNSPDREYRRKRSKD